MSKQQDFINQIVQGAIFSMKKHGVCASVTIAQAILESGWNSSTLSQKAFNLFGVKADSGWKGQKINMKTAEYTRSNEKYFIDADFRKYSSFSESVEDHALFLVNNSRYKANGLFNSLDYKKQTAALQNAGYATSPEYSKMLNELIEQYKLYEYDKIKKPTYQERYVREFQKFYNEVTKTKTPLIVDGVYGANTQSSLDALLGYIKQGKKYKYCLEFQKFYNKTTQTTSPIGEDSTWGPSTEKAYKFLEQLVKGEY